MNFNKKTAALLLLLIVAFQHHACWASTFGKNKLQTRHFDWQVLETDHFLIHYYPDEIKLAEEAAEYAEEAYHIDTQLIRYRPNEKTSIFLYRNQIDFQQTNISSQVIGVGTAGFTEAYKNRIVLPAPASPRSFKEVIIHEFIHALQFNILYGEGIRSFRVYKGYLIPLWFIEGMAEYASERWDSIDDMIVRDAVINERMLPLTLLEGFTHLDDVYLAYKESQLALMYIDEQYGRDKIGMLFRKFKTQLSISQILRETLGIGLNEFNQSFFFWLKQRYWTTSKGKNKLEEYGTLVDPLPENKVTNTSGPAWSPDGRYLAFISNKDGTMKIYLKPRGKRGNAYSITNKPFEYFDYQGRPLTWSPDSRNLAFVTQAEGRVSLNLINIKSRHIRSINVPIDGISSPAWSPDGRSVAMTGVRNGIADIYIWDLKNKKLTKLTEDRWCDKTPCWTPDGKTIIYSSERNERWQLVMIDVETVKKNMPTVITDDKSDHIQPLVSPDGQYLYYSSDRNGHYNIYRKDLTTGTVIQLTDVITGAFQPSLSTSMQKLTFTGYEKGQWGVRLMALDNDLSTGKEIGLSEPVIQTGPQEIKDHETDIDTADFEQADIIPAKKEPAAYNKQTEHLIKKQYPYTFRFSPDLLFLLAGYDSSQGLVGGGYLTASDYLGDHQISLISEIVPGYQSQTTLSYGNYRYPIDIIIAAQYSKNYYKIMDLETDTMLDEFNDEEIGGGFLLSKPFSTFDRLELEYAMDFVKREYDEAIINKRVTSCRLSLVHDSTSWLDFSPSSGMRHNLSFSIADKILGGEEQYQLFQLNSQAYTTLELLNPYAVFGIRLMSAVSTGTDHPLYMFGGIGLLADTVTIRGFQLGELLGSQIMAVNTELRFPLVRNMHYSLWPLDFLMMKHLQMVVFDDMAVVSNDLTKISERDIKNSIGIGFRLHTFLLGKELLTIRFDIAHRTDKVRDTVYTWGLGHSF